MNRTIRVLFVDDDDVFRRVLSRELERAGFEVQGFASAIGVVEHAEARAPDVAVLDLRLPGESGLELLPRLLEACPSLPVIMLTGHGAIREAVEAMRLGCYDFFTKPVPLEKIEATLRRACERSELVAENRRLRRAIRASASADTIVGKSAARVELREIITRVAPSDASVLIQGESGTGKELAARSIHAQSGRASESMIVVNAAAIPTNLVESELFGHVRGAFTGADKERLGLFEAAHGGTLFLDEIAELPKEVQALLLRALQFGEIRPVGSTKSRTVDVRVVAATNRDLMEEVAAGRFREDLYYRLAAVTVHVPPLRDCIDDIPELIEIFLARNVAKLDRTRRFTRDALEELACVDWPGNVRELENVVARLCILSEDEEIDAKCVRRHATTHRLEATPVASLRLEVVEKATIVAALERFDGHKRKAAEALGIAVKTLYNKLDRYKLRKDFVRGPD